MVYKTLNQLASVFSQISQHLSIKSTYLAYSYIYKILILKNLKREN